LGIFGIGGGLMIIVSIVLASQTFVVDQQLSDPPVPGFALMVAAGMGVWPRFRHPPLPPHPYFNRMMLKPPAAEDKSRRAAESLAVFDAAGQSGPIRRRAVDVRNDEFSPGNARRRLMTGNMVVVRRVPDT
jgi:membrane-bound serine protease (ClpP class)